MSNSIQEKDKKIQQLRSLLGQAKHKINSIKQQLVNKDKQIQNVKQNYENKIKKLQANQAELMKQYEERMIRLQKSLEQSDNLVLKYQKLSQANSKNYENIINQLTNISNLILKNFTIIPNKQNNQAIEELCNIQKCKDFQQKILQFQNQMPDLRQIIKSISKMNMFYEQSIRKKRQARLLYLKKQSVYQKQLEDQQKKNQADKKQIQNFRLKLKNTQQKYEKQIQTIAKSKAKVVQEKTNIQFIKQLLIKVILGPKQATLMAFEVLSKVLKFSENQHNMCHKKLK